jgi:hypothetical protein
LLVGSRAAVISGCGGGDFTGIGIILGAVFLGLRIRPEPGDFAVGWIGI